MKSWDNTFINIAQEIAEHSTCKKLHVGAILVQDKRIISCGYNGSPSGMEHCCDHFATMDITTPAGRIAHHEFSEKYELHAEQNCIAYLVRNGSKIDDNTILYITTAPCKNCAKLIISAGIKHVVYLNEYKTDEGIEFLRDAQVEIYKYR